MDFTPRELRLLIESVQLAEHDDEFKEFQDEVKISELVSLERRLRKHKEEASTMEDKARQMRDLALVSGILQSCIDSLTMITEMLGTDLPEGLVKRTRESINLIRSTRSVATSHFTALEKSRKDYEA